MRDHGTRCKSDHCPSNIAPYETWRPWQGQAECGENLFRSHSSAVGRPRHNPSWRAASASAPALPGSC
eukprot:2913772-Pyramimonas_sp.AAC.1